MKIYNKDTFGKFEVLEYITEYIKNNPDKSKNIISFLSRTNKKLSNFGNIMHVINETNITYPLYMLELIKKEGIETIDFMCKSKSYPYEINTRLKNFLISSINNQRNKIEENLKNKCISKNKEIDDK